jgi:glycosyltransferase involved in cell wall biosynthesis
MKSVDVVILTKNSERLLKRCIDSVYKNVPVNNLIVVDGRSTDSTLQIIQEFQRQYGNVITLQDRGTRGSARQEAMQRVSTDWFVFVDSDVILSNNWYAQAQRFVADDVGAVWGIEIWSVLQKMRLLGLFERFTLKIFEKRGGTHDLLVRRKAIEDIQVPFQLHTYEDAYIKSWICKKGYKVFGVYEPYCIHFRPEAVWTAKQNINFIVSDLKYAIHHPSLLLSYCFYTCIVMSQIVSHRFQTRKPRNQTAIKNEPEHAKARQ